MPHDPRDRDSPRIPPDERASGRSGLRDPGSPVAGVVSWLAVAGMVGLILLSHTMVGASEQKQTEPSPTAGILQLFARYAAAATELAPGAQSAQVRDELLDTIESTVATPDDALRATLAAHGMGATERAAKILDRVTDPTGEGITPLPGDVPEQRPAYIAEDAARVRTVLESGAEALDPADWAVLSDHHGWFAYYGRTAGMPPTASDRQAALRPADRTLFAIVALAFTGGTGLLGGVVLLIVLLIRLGNGRVRTRYTPPAPGGSVYLETLAIFLAAFVGLGLIGDALRTATNTDPTEALMWLLPLVLLWPMVRGARRVETKYALGWHRGEGFLKEIGAGLVGYLAGLPVVALGFLLTLLLAFLMAAVSGAQGPPPSHPVVQQAGGGGVWSVLSLYLLASVWAPIVEESVFRGALFHHLRGRLGALASAAIVGFLFAIIHPQGILLVPPLMALGFVFCMIREWRGSLIGSMAAHALHNAVLITVLIVAMS